MSDMTLQQLEAAFERLKNGTPERTKADDKISILRINEEAGLSRGGIYYYKDFVIKAKAEIEAIKNQRKTQNAIRDVVAKENKTDKLRAERDKEKRLKVDYRNQVNEFSQFSDQLVIENVLLAFRCYELQERETKRERMKVVPIR